MKIHFRWCIPYDENNRPIGPECDASYRDFIKPICDYFNDVCGFHVAAKIVNNSFGRDYFELTCDDVHTKDIDNYTLTVENGKVVDVYVNPHKCYVIRFENANEYGEEILYNEGIFEAKEDAIGRIKEIAEQICQERGMIIKHCPDDWTDCEYADLCVGYETCSQCPMYEDDRPCIGECSADYYRFGLVEYVLHKKGE